ncbi:S8 family serine peptidase [Paenibacillus sp. sgz500958]|uniref:S8 family serine peptidase n=1 Tax=Paenibacillus sp. sgz500958 TaxID=3242475 RepID=UPI0036D27531
MNIKKKMNRLAVALAALFLFANSQMAYAVERPVPGTEQEVIVVYKNEEGKDLILEESVDVGYEFESIPAVSATVTSSDLNALMNDPNIDYIERNTVFQMTDSSFNAVTSVIPAEQSQWSFQEVHPTAMWDEGYTGTGVKVAVVDSGIFLHSELNIAGGISTVDYTTSYTDDNGHGTHVAGIIAANNNSVAMVGVAPDVQLYAVKALNQLGKGNLADILEGVDWAIKNHMDIINLSLGTDEDSLALKQMVDSAYSEGILVVASSGNSQEGKPVSQNTVNYPAKYDSVIAVGAVDSSNARGSFSSAGSEVEVAAPGVDIVSTYEFNGTQGYAMASGTSQAAPHVTGMLALLKQKYPSMTNVQLREEIRKYAVDLGTPGRDIEFGFGSLTFSKDITAPSNVTGLKVTDKTDSSLSLAWSNPAESDFAASNIYVNNVKAGTTAEQTYTVNALLPSTSYTVAVKSVDLTGNESAGVSVTEATYAETAVIDLTPPAEVTGLKADESTTSTIKLSWSNPADADFSKVKVYLNGSAAGETSASGFELTDLLADTEYNIVVKTVDASSNVSAGVALKANTQAVSVVTQPVVTAPSTPDPGGSLPGSGVISLPMNPTPAPSGGTAVIAAPTAQDKDKKSSGDVESVLGDAEESHTVSDFVKAKQAVLALNDTEERKEFQQQLNELKETMGVKDVPAKNEIRSAAPIGISLQIAMKSTNFKTIDVSSIKPGENIFVLNSKGEPVEGVNIRVVFNRILITPGQGSFPVHETFTILIDKSVKGKPSPGSGTAYELKNPIMLEFTTR